VVAHAGGGGGGGPTIGRYVVLIALMIHRSSGLKAYRSACECEVMHACSTTYARVNDPT
jgi:hypothetical protein